MSPQRQSHRGTRRGTLHSDRLGDPLSRFNDRSQWTLLGKGTSGDTYLVQLRGIGTNVALKLVQCTDIGKANDVLQEVCAFANSLG